MSQISFHLLADRTPLVTVRSVLSWFIIVCFLVGLPQWLGKLKRIPRENLKERRRLLLAIFLAVAIVIVQVVDLLGWID